MIKLSCADGEPLWKDSDRAYVTIWSSEKNAHAGFVVDCEEKAEYARARVEMREKERDRLLEVIDSEIRHLCELKQKAEADYMRDTFWLSYQLDKWTGGR